MNLFRKSVCACGHDQMFHIRHADRIEKVGPDGRCGYGWVCDGDAWRALHKTCECSMYVKP